MTTNEILATVRRKLLEATTEIVEDETLLLYANQAYLDIRKRVFPNSDIKSATIAFTLGVGTLPTDFGTMYGDAVDVGKNRFPEVAIADFITDPLERMVTIEAGSIKVYPEATTSLTIRYYPVGVTLTTSQNPTIDSYFHEPIVYGTLMRALEDLQEDELAKENEAKYEGMLERRTGVLSNYEEGNQRGGQMFIPQQLI